MAEIMRMGSGVKCSSVLITVDFVS